MVWLSNLPGRKIWGSNAVPPQSNVESNRNLLTVAVDDNMAYALCVSLASLQKSSKRPFDVVVGFLRGALSAQNRKILSDVTDALGITLDFHELLFDQRFITQGHISPTTFTKFLLSDFYEQAHLWIDADTAGLSGWDQLFEAVAVATSEAGLVVAERGDPGEKLRNGKLNPSDLPFNAGVLGWPRGSRRDWSNALNDTAAVETQEQYLLNVLYADTALRVSEKFNTMSYRIDALRSTEAPHIIHYAGAHKPWHLPRRFARLCSDHGCPWSIWFAAERYLTETTGPGSLQKELAAAARAAQKSGGTRWQRDNSGLLLLRLLGFLGPLGWLLAVMAKPLKKWIPRGTHPFH